MIERFYRGESLLDRDNFFITLIAVLFANVYALMTFYICDFTQDKLTGWLVHIELFLLLICARHWEWMQFSI